MNNSPLFITEKYQGGKTSIMIQNIERELFLFFSEYPYALTLLEDFLKLNNAYLNDFNYIFHAEGFKEYSLEVNYHYFNYRDILPDIYKFTGNDEDFDDMFWDTVKITIPESNNKPIVSIEYLHKRNYGGKETQIMCPMTLLDHYKKIPPYTRIAQEQYRYVVAKDLIALNERFRERRLKNE